MSHVTGPIESRIAEIDALISLQLNEIMHHEDFLRLEASWRGLSYLVNETQPDKHLKIKVLQGTKNDLLKDHGRAVEFDRSSLFKKVYDETYETFWADPFGLLIGIYEFGTHPNDLEVLEHVSRVAAAAHAPFISAASPDLFGWDDFSQIHGTPDISEIFDRPEYGKWNRFRELEDSRFAGLCMPHILLREPHTKESGGKFNFDESDSLETLLWGNAVYAFATCIAKSYREIGWCGLLNGPGSVGFVEGLAEYEIDGSDRSVDVQIDARNENELSGSGFIPLVQNSTDNLTAFYSDGSCNKPSKYDSEVANANALAGTKLPYILGIGRFAHYLKVIVRDRAKPYSDAEHCQKDLNNWLNGYFHPTGEIGDPMRSRYPLGDIRINVVELPGNPGEFRGTAFVLPEYQLGMLRVSLRTVIDLPANRGNLINNISNSVSPDHTAETVDPAILKLLNEPFLDAQNSTDGMHSYRFFWNRTWYENRLFRVNIDPNKTGTIVVKAYRIRPERGQLVVDWIQNDVILLNVEQVTWWLDVVKYFRFWEIKSEPLGRSGMDGSSWLIEGIREGHYHEISRWTPSEPEIVALGKAFIGLARLQLDEDSFF